MTYQILAIFVLIIPILLGGFLSFESENFIYIGGGLFFGLILYFTISNFEEKNL